jgi:hypothetical protein
MNAPTNISLNPPVSEAAEVRVAQYNWKALTEELSSQGCVVIENLISPDECRQIAELYPHERHFRSHVHMARHGFGRGEYRYFKYPLPALIGNLREALYPRLANIANDWNARMKVDQRYPSAHADGSVHGRGVISGGIGGGKARRSGSGTEVVTAAGGLGWSCSTSH